MNILTLLEKKHHKQALTSEEIDWFVNASLSNEIKDYQISSMLTSMYINDLSIEETVNLTTSMYQAGEVIPLSEEFENTLDKHSTGGVGDKISFITMPILATFGYNVAMMSGRSLGFTGGTVDKMESIASVDMALSNERIIEDMKKDGFSIFSQSKEVCPTDKIFYAMRDTTATVDNIKLIASSIMSKKIATGCKKILLDLKIGRASFLKTHENAKAIANIMMQIASAHQVKLFIMITEMSAPLGYAIGNKIEMIESFQILLDQHHKSPIAKQAKEMAAHVLVLDNVCDDMTQALKEIDEKIANKQAYNKLADMISSQKTNKEAFSIDDLKIAPKYQYEIKASETGYINDIDALLLGKFGVELKISRINSDDKVENDAGFWITKHINDPVKNGDVIMRVFSNQALTNDQLSHLEQAFSYGNKKINKAEIIEIFTN